MLSDGSKHSADMNRPRWDWTAPPPGYLFQLAPLKRTCAERRERGYSKPMPKDQDKKRTAKTNKPKLTAKEKKLKKLAKKGK